jgi:phage terminase large subunit-like protein
LSKLPTLAQRLSRPYEEMSTAERLRLDPSFEDQIRAMTAQEALAIQWDWRFWARPKQLAPEGFWTTWLARAGRGWGKTRCGTGWVQEIAMREPKTWFALVAKNPADARDYMIEGPGGFRDPRGRNVKPEDRPHYEPSKRRLTWPNGSWATIYSDEEPDQLRGFSGRYAWLDEFGKYDHPEEVLMNLDFGMREAGTVGEPPRKLFTLTPKVIGKANAVIKALEARKSTIVVNGSSYENRANLDPNWFSETILPYEGTQTGREEIHGELLDPEEQGIVKRSYFRLWPYDKALPKFEYIIVSYDTALTEKAYDKDTHDPDPTACQVWGLFFWRDKGVMRPGILLLDCWGDYLGFPELLSSARKEMQTRYGEADAPIVPALIGPTIGTGEGRRPDLLLVEDNGAGRSMLQTLAREDLFGTPYNPGKLSKLARLHMVSHVFEQRHIWLPESENPARRNKPKDWCEALLEQICAFRGEGSIKHDDHVDACTQAIKVFLDKHLFRATTPPIKEDEHSQAYAAASGDRWWRQPMIQNQERNPYDS